MRFRHHRYPTTVPVSLHIRNKIEKAQIVDVNETGACLICHLPLPVGSIVKLQFGNQSIAARTMWARRGRLGIAFDRLQPIDIVDRLRQGNHSRSHHVRFNSTHLRELR